MSLILWAEWLGGWGSGIIVLKESCIVEGAAYLVDSVGPGMPYLGNIASGAAISTYMTSGSVD